MIYGSTEKQGSGRAEAGAGQEDRWGRREEEGVSEPLLRFHLRRAQAQAASSVQRIEGGSGVGGGSPEGLFGDVGAGSFRQGRGSEREQRRHQDWSARQAGHGDLVWGFQYIPRQA